MAPLIVPWWKVKPDRLAAPARPRLHPPNLRSTHSMSTVTIPITAPTTRTDGTALDPSEISRMDVELSDDNGLTFTNVGHAAADQTEFVIDNLDPGNYLARATATDTQDPPLTSEDSSPVSFQVAAPPLAAPNPPTLGAPVVSEPAPAPETASAAKAAPPKK